LLVQLVVQDDRNVVILNGLGEVTWSTGTALPYVPPQPLIRITDTLQMNQVLNSGESLYSSDGGTIVTLEPQCFISVRNRKINNNIVKTFPFIGTNTSINSSKSPCRLVMQSDGNLVLYSATNTAVWNSQSAVAIGGPFTFVVQNDGNVVVYAGPTALWSGQTNK